jgi:hypothetical protein
MERINALGPKIFKVLSEGVEDNAEAVVAMARALACLRTGKCDADALREALNLAIQEVDDVAKPYGGIENYCAMSENKPMGAN